MLSRPLTVLAVLSVAAVVSAAPQAPQQTPPQPPPGTARPAPKSPPAEATVSIAGKTITIAYSAPSVRGREIYGPNGLLAKDKTYPVWRTGANAATSLRTDADLQFKGLTVPAGTYTLFTKVDQEPWLLIVNKQTGQWGTIYSEAQDLGRIPLEMGKPPALVETLKISLTATGPSSGLLKMEWENKTASVPFTVK
jgi:hypothetical protein